MIDKQTIEELIQLEEEATFISFDDEMSRILERNSNEAIIKTTSSEKFNYISNNLKDVIAIHGELGKAYNSLTEVVIFNPDFNGVTLYNTKFEFCEFLTTGFENIRFVNCDFNHCRFKDSLFHNVSFYDCRIYETKLIDCTFVDVCFRLCMIEQSKFHVSSLFKTSFPETYIKGLTIDTNELGGLEKFTHLDFNESEDINFLSSLISFYAIMYGYRGRQNLDFIYEKVLKEEIRYIPYKKLQGLTFFENKTIKELFNDICEHCDIDIV